MSIAVYITPLAEQQVSRFRGKDRVAFDRFTQELGHGGCRALGYRLSGPEPLRQLCVKHLTGAMRVVVAFRHWNEAWIVLVGLHDRDPGIDIYTALYELAGVTPPDDAGRTKPPCCDPGSHLPAEMGAKVDELVARARKLRGR